MHTRGTQLGAATLRPKTRTMGAQATAGKGGLPEEGIVGAVREQAKVLESVHKQMCAVYSECTTKGTGAFEVKGRDMEYLRANWLQLLADPQMPLLVSMCEAMLIQEEKPAPADATARAEGQQAGVLGVRALTAWLKTSNYAK